MDTLFDPPAEHDALRKRITALFAPVAANRAAVVDDVDLIDIARAMFHAFGSADAVGGLTRSQLWAACTEVCDEEQFNSRFDLFKHLEMLEEVFDKAHQRRVVFNPTSAAGIMVLDRLAQNGGVDELMMLLDRTRSDIASGRITQEEAQAHLRTALRMMTITADHLFRLVGNAVLAELMAQHRHHDHQTLMHDVHALDDLVRDVFPNLDAEMFALVSATQRYNDARDQFMDRLLKEGAASKDFSLLEPEDYLAAARSAKSTELASVFAGIVFDPPSPLLDPGTIARRLTEYVPPPPPRRRPPRPLAPVAGVDPMAEVEERARLKAQQRQLLMGQLLQDHDEVDLTSRIRSTPWPGGAAVLVQALSLHTDPDLPVTVHFSDELLVDADAQTTRATPVHLRRTAPSPQVMTALAEFIDAAPDPSESHPGDDLIVVDAEASAENVGETR